VHQVSDWCSGHGGHGFLIRKYRFAPVPSIGPNRGLLVWQFHCSSAAS
jgi:hypothetical protein